MTSQAEWFREAGLNPDGNGSYSGPETFTAADLMALELPPVKWVVPDLLPEGVTLLAGKPKLGKSWLALGTTVAVASGGVVLGTKRVEQGEVLYLALEDNQRRLQKRVRKLLGAGHAPEGLHISTAWPRVDEGGEEELEEWIEDRSGARLVVVDVLKRIRPRTTRYQSVYDADYESLEALHAFADRHGVAVLCIHHLRKAAADDPMDEISGSTGLSAAADGVLLLRRARGRGDAYLHVDGRDIEEPAELALTWNQNTACWTLAGDAEQYRLSQTRAEVIRVLEEDGEPMTPTEVADALGKSYNTVKQRLWQMSREGQVLASDGRYSLPKDRNSRNPHNRNSEELVTAVTQVTHDPDDSEDVLSRVEPIVEPPRWRGDDAAVAEWVEGEI
jgi:DNA-binding Lrp family transcriptional regulator